MILCCSHELIFNVSQAVSLEVRAHWNNDVSRGVYQTFYGLSCFSPVINIARHPLWGRTQVKTIHLIRSLHGSFRVAHSLFSFSFSFSFSFLAGNFSDQLQHLSRALESVTGMTQNIIHVIHDVTSIRWLPSCDPSYDASNHSSSDLSRNPSCDSSKKVHQTGSDFVLQHSK